MKIAALFTLGACAVPVPDPNPVDPAHDFDQDGLDEQEGDCDDRDGTVGGPVERYPDDDADGFAARTPLTGCPDVGGTTPGTDCDDADPAIGDTLFAYVDADLDGIGRDPAEPVGCTLPVGYSLVAGDCDDTDRRVPDDVDWCWTTDVVEDCGPAPGPDCALAGESSVASGAALDLDSPTEVDETRVWAGGADFDDDGQLDVVLGAHAYTGDARIRIAFGGSTASGSTLDLHRAVTPGTRGWTQGVGLAFDGGDRDDLVVMDHNPNQTLTAGLWIVYGPIAPAGAVRLLPETWSDADELVVPIAADPEAAPELAYPGFALAAGALEAGSAGDDLVVTAPSSVDDAHPDYVYVLEGRVNPGRGLSIAMDGLRAESVDPDIDGLGDAALHLPDVDGGATPAVALSSRGGGSPSEVVIVLGADLLASSLDTPYGQWQAANVAPAGLTTSLAWGDLDGSGRADLVLGSPDDADPGEVWIVPDPDPTGFVDLPQTGYTRVVGHPSCGAAVSIVANGFGPGLPGLAIGCPRKDEVFLDGAGSVYLVAGADLLGGNVDLDSLSLARIHGGYPNFSTGRSLAAPEGGSELVIGAASVDVLGDAWLFSGGLQP